MMVSKCVGFNWNNYHYSLGCCPGNQAATSLICTVSRHLLNSAHLTAAAKQPDCAVSGGRGRLPCSHTNACHSVHGDRNYPGPSEA